MDIIAPNEPTYYPVNQHYQPSTIDLGLAKGIQNISVSTSEDLSSDHNPVYFLVGLDNIILEPKNQILLTNWSKFNRNLSNTMCGNPLINDLNELDKAVDNFALSIQTAINQSSKAKIIEHPYFNIPFPTRLKINLAEKFGRILVIPPLKMK
ncbi:RNA-directed DNA polymerase from mobile element jockey [Nephila pilipes]|uniref:RNA-directed DNA polymerase from mobile element jockey n=1 Tax=Nephila pilipes TaxID=299642 RepID=A0A8X6US22_NEPPI|nr:RNA-directed DNA polymerase from mobile element jockey [Nephila pilipes]